MSITSEGAADMNTGERIKARRKELGLSADELAAKLGKNRATVYRYESNDIENLPAKVLGLLSEALETTPGYLMGWTDDSYDYDITEYLEMLRTRPECRMLFSLTKDATKEDVEKAVAIITALRSTEGK